MNHLKILVDTCTWRELVDGAHVEKWPHEKLPMVGDRVVVFDKNMEFTQHLVTGVDGQAVDFGEAIPWARVR